MIEKIEMAQVKSVLQKIGYDSKRRNEPLARWNVHQEVTVDEVLAMIRDRDGNRLADYPFTDDSPTTNRYFTDRAEAVEQLFMARLLGGRYNLIDTDTGEVQPE